MFHLHFQRNLRSVAFLVVALALAALPVVLWWANRSGLPPSWRAAIETAIGQHGAHVRIGGLQYLPLRGLAATDLRVYQDEARTVEISRLERVLIGFDKTRLARGEVRITKLQLRNGRLSMPVTPDDPDSEVLRVTGANGLLLMPGGRRMEVRGVTGRIAGIDVEVDVRFQGRRGSGEPTGESDRMERRRRLIADILHQINQWSFDEQQPPRVVIQFEHNLNQRSAMRAKVRLVAKAVERNGYTLDEVRGEAEIAGNLVTVTSLEARDGRGELQGRLDYDTERRHGRFDARSSLDILPLMRLWLGFDLPGGMVFGGSQKIESAGEFQLGGDGKPRVHLTGRADCGSVAFRGFFVERFETAFSWRGDEMFLRDVVITRPDGAARGKAMIQWPMVRLAIDSDLPAQAYLPLFKGQPLEEVIGDFEARAGASCQVSLEGGLDLTNPRFWAYTGSGEISNTSYRGVPLKSARCRFSLSSGELDFRDGTVVFDYRGYPLRNAFKGPAEGTARVGRIRYNGDSKTVDVENVRGRLWAAPLVRMFAPKVADSLEAYRFHQPPELTGSGVVDVTPRGRTRLDVTFGGAANADYEFLGETVTLANPSAAVKIRGPRVLVENLAFESFGGPVAARFDSPGDGTLTGELSWTRLAIPSICSTYGFRMKAGGNTTGRLEFGMKPGDVRTMTGEGLFAVEDTELFSVPVFGPLSPLISGVLKDRRAGFERATSAFCNFRIRDGVLASRDFNTATPSLNFAADGKLDLATRELEMTMRMNARGLLGLITLPLRPFYGMFQFRGTGPLDDPEWENVMFTQPPPEQDELLKDPPKARIVR